MSTENSTDFKYISGFNTHMASEALPNTLPKRGNSPQKPAHGLYAEQVSGTAFTAIRSENRRVWLYRKLPTVNDARISTYDGKLKWQTAPLQESVVPFEPLRWLGTPEPSGKQDFLQGIETIGVNGGAAVQSGCAIHVYTANQSMENSALCNADGEMLVVPQQGVLHIQTELGWLAVKPGEITVIPRGIVFRVVLADGIAQGYILENYGAMFRLPEMGPIGANGMATPKDFLSPVAHFDDKESSYQVVTKLCGAFHVRTQAYSPFNVVAWHGNLTPYKYDLYNYNTFGSVSFDSPDPCISTVLTSPSHLPGTADIDFVAFPPRWQVGENTFRPPYFHRNIMSEFMGLVYGVYEGKKTGFVPGGFSIHTCMAPHGPDKDTLIRGRKEPQKPNKLDGTMAFMFETRLPLSVQKSIFTDVRRDVDYTQSWGGFDAAKLP